MSETLARTLLLVSPDDTFAERVTTALYPRFQIIRVNPATDQIETVLGSSRPDACLIDVEGANWDRSPDMVPIATVRQFSDQMPIIVATFDLSATTLVPAMRAGANDVCDKDVATDELVAQMDWHVNSRPARWGEEAARMYTFFGARGGVGTSTVALAVSELLARRAGPDNRILLLDFSQPPPEIPDIVGGQANYFMNDAVHDLPRLDATLIDGAFLCAPPGNLYVLPLAADERGLEALELDDLMKLVTVLRTYFHAVVADVNRSWHGRLAERLFLSADRAFLCVSQSINVVHASSVFLDRLRGLEGAEPDFRLVVTRHEASLKPGAPDLQKALGAAGAPLLVPEDRRYVETARNAGDPLTGASPRGAFARAIGRLVAEAITADNAPTESRARMRGGGLRGRLGRLLGAPAAARAE